MSPTCSRVANAVTVAAAIVFVVVSGGAGCGGTGGCVVDNAATVVALGVVVGTSTSSYHTSTANVIDSSPRS